MILACKTKAALPDCLADAAMQLNIEAEVQYRRDRQNKYLQLCRAGNLVNTYRTMLLYESEGSHCSVLRFSLSIRGWTRKHELMLVSRIHELYPNPPIKQLLAAVKGITGSNRG